MPETLFEHLRALYGPATASAVAPQLHRLLESYQARLLAVRVPGGRLPLSQRDALLITYADQVRENGLAPLRSLAEFCEAHLREVVSGLHLLPFYPSSSDDGFSVKNYCAVDPALGSWNDVERLGRHFDLMFDAVFNHLSAQSEWFQRFVHGDPKFSDFFVTVEGNPDLSQVVRPRALPLLTEFPTAGGPKKVWTTFSADQVDLNFKNPAVLLAVLEALLFYVAKGATFIRLDAIAYLWKQPGTPCLHLPQTHRVIQFLRAELDEVAPHVRLITETNVPHADNVSYFGDGANEAQLVYNFALPPLVLHSLATGNAATLTRWAATLQTPSPGTAFFNFLASHDGIGLNPAHGILSDAEIDALVARAQAHGGFVSCKHNPDGSQSPYELNINFFDALSNPAAQEPIDRQIDRFLVAQAVLLALAGVPGIYFHSLFGSRGNRVAAEASGIVRRINREKLTRSELEHDLADPNSLRARIFRRFRELLQMRRSHAAFHPLVKQDILNVDDRLFALIRTEPRTQDRLLCLHNLSNESVEARVRMDELGGAARWRNLFGRGAFTGNSGRVLPVRLRPYEIVWAARE